MIATAAAVGAVATGTFTALIPTSGDTASSASADESPINAVLAANTAALGPAAKAATVSAVGFLTPVTYSLDSSDGAAGTDGFAGADQHLAMLGKAADIAAQIAQQHAQEQAAQAERDRVSALIAKGGLDSWIAEALQVLDLPQSLAPSVKKIIMQESGGNPKAINTWDSNARRGTPSQGLMQTIPSTFRAYVAPEMAGRPITDPVANITAGIRYMIANYGIDTLQDGGRRNSSGGYVGY